MIQGMSSSCVAEKSRSAVACKEPRRCLGATLKVTGLGWQARTAQARPTTISGISWRRAIPRESRQKLLGVRRSRRQREVAVRAEVSADDLLSKAKAITSTQLYSVWLQGTVVLVILASIDAAYSGDWSRIGVITPEIEDALKPLLTSLGFFHIFCAAVAAYSASSKGLSVPKSVAKVLAVGGLALFEVLLKDPEASTP